MEKNIILTGFMGTGKTAVGRRLAKLLSYTFVDTDSLIEARDGRSIPQIFAEAGEAPFRQMEHEIARELAGAGRTVISTGGGLLMNEANTAVLSQNGIIFCLTAEVDTILARVSIAEGVERPLLAGPDPKARIEALLAERQETYGQFIQLATDGKTIDEVARELLKRIKSNEW
jgi:shikimate kinase